MYWIGLDTNPNLGLLTLGGTWPSTTEGQEAFKVPRQNPT